MNWNNRIFKHVAKGEVYYGLHETYYGLDAESDLDYTINPSTGLWDSIDQLIGDLEQKLNDAKKCREDILDYENLD